jgi:hypothetical protein
MFFAGYRNLSIYIYIGSCIKAVPGTIKPGQVYQSSRKLYTVCLNFELYIYRERERERERVPGTRRKLKYESGNKSITKIRDIK